MRAVASYVLKLCVLERQTFFAYFVAGKNLALDQLLAHFGTVFYDILRPLIVHCDDLDVLREVADALAFDVLEPYGFD